MRVPGRNLVESETQVFHFVAGCHTRITVRDIEGWKGAQILLGTSNDELELENVDFKSINLRPAGGGGGV